MPCFLWVSLSKYFIATIKCVVLCARLAPLPHTPPPQARNECGHVAPVYEKVLSDHQIVLCGGPVVNWETFDITIN